MKIILGVDESPCSAAAVDHVRRASWPAGSSVLVLTAVKPVVLAVPEAYMVLAGQVETLKREQVQRGLAYVKKIADELAPAGLKVESRVVEGDPRDVLVETCRSQNADLVVLGSHGRTGLSKLLLGSVAAHVVTHAPCSVLIVRRP